MATDTRETPDQADYLRGHDDGLNGRPFNGETFTRYSDGYNHGESERINRLEDEALRLEAVLAEQVS